MSAASTHALGFFRSSMLDQIERMISRYTRQFAGMSHPSLQRALSFSEHLFGRHLPQGADLDRQRPSQPEATQPDPASFLLPDTWIPSPAALRFDSGWLARTQRGDGPGDAAKGAATMQPVSAKPRIVPLVPAAKGTVPLAARPGLSAPESLVTASPGVASPPDARPPLAENPPPSSPNPTAAAASVHADFRVRDLLAAMSAQQPVPSLPVTSHSTSLRHLSWADGQLAHSPWWRAQVGDTAAVPSGPMSRGWDAAPAMPMLAPAPTPAKPEAAPVRRTPSERPPVVAPPVALPRAATQSTLGKPPAADSSQVAPAQIVGRSPAHASTDLAPIADQGLAADVSAAVAPLLGAQDTEHTSTDAVARSLDVPAADVPSIAAPASSLAEEADAVPPQGLSSAPTGVSPFRSPMDDASVDASSDDSPARAPDQPISLPATIGLPAAARPAAARPLAAEAPPPLRSSASRPAWRAASSRLPTGATTGLRLDSRLLPTRDQVGSATPSASVAQASVSPSVRRAWSSPGGLASLFQATSSFLPSLVGSPLADVSSASATWSTAPGISKQLSLLFSRRSAADLDASPGRWAVDASLPWVAASDLSPRDERRTRTPARVDALPALTPPSPGIAARAPGRPSILPALSQASVAAHQPWRAAGGTAALAELFAAGVGLGSGSAGTVAALTASEHAQGPSLLASWVHPLLSAHADPAPHTPGLHSPESPRLAQSDRLSLSGLPYLPSAHAARPAALPTQQSRPSLAPSLLPIAATALPGSLSRLAATRQAEPGAPPQPSAMPQPVEGMARTTQETASLSPFSAGLAQPWSPIGGIAARSEQFGLQQVGRSTAAGLPMATAASHWTAGPGVSEQISAVLAQAGRTEAAGWQRALPSLPYLGLSPVGLPAQRSLPSAGLAAPLPTSVGLTQQSPGRDQISAERRLRAPSQPQASVPPLPAGLETPVRPWLSLGGAGTLAELFAAGVALNSGSAAAIGQVSGEHVRRGDVLPRWMVPLLRDSLAPASMGPASQGFMRAPTDLPWATPSRLDLAARDSVRQPSPGRPPAPTNVGVSPRPLAASQAAPAGQSPLLAQRGQGTSFSSLGGLSLWAERFASATGLAAQASTDGPGTWLPVTGGLVWVPRAERGESSPAVAQQRQIPSTIGSEKAATPVPSRPSLRTERDPLFGRSSTASPLTLGGLGLSSELFAASSPAHTEISLAGGAPLRTRTGLLGGDATDADKQGGHFASAGLFGLPFVPRPEAPSADTASRRAFSGRAQESLSRLGAGPSPMVNPVPLGTGVTAGRPIGLREVPGSQRSDQDLSALLRSVMSWASPWQDVPAEVARLGIQSLPLVPPQTDVATGAGRGQLGTRPFVLPRTPDLLEKQSAQASRLVERHRPLHTDVPAHPIGANAMPVTDGAAASASRAPASHEPYALAARYVAPMLGAFAPSDTTERSSGERTHEVSSQLLRRIEQIVGRLSVAAHRLPELASLLAAAGPSGHLLWQRLNEAKPIAERARVASPTPATGLALTSGGYAPPEVRYSAAGESSGEDQDEADRRVEAPALTMISGGRSPAQASESRSATASAAKPVAAEPAGISFVKGPGVDLLRSALASSGASREQVDASIKLMNAIQSHAKGQPTRSDDRLSIGDLTMVAISMGENRMAAATTRGQLSGVPSVEAALRLPTAQQPAKEQSKGDQDTVIDGLAERVMRTLEQMEAAAAIRAGYDM